MKKFVLFRIKIPLSPPLYPNNLKGTRKRGLKRQTIHYLAIFSCIRS
jgi:hypothetical protein